MSNSVLTETFGYLGAVTLTITLLPQLYLTLKTKKVENLSMGFLLLQQLTCILFLVYGIMLNAVPLMVANSIVGTQGLMLIILKKIYQKKRDEESSV